MLIGIDLGTSTSEAAFADESGNIAVIPNGDGEFITPSVVHIRQSGRAVVGAEAREYLFTRPESTFMEVKRRFGTGEKLAAHGKLYAPEEIQAHILAYLADCAAELAGKDVTGAVITVPAYFTDVQRRQTIRAGELAGLKVERVINEPTAAAMDYGLQNLTECSHILVYDFGGGTLDVTVLELFEGVLDVKASSGNNHLGGKDFDEALMKHIAGTRYNRIMADPRAAMKLKRAATECKEALSAEGSAVARLPLLLPDLSIGRTVTRAEFEALIAPLIESTGEQIDAALADAKLTAAELQKVLLVGGTTRIPAVKQFVGKKLGFPPDAADSPELMVVRGAAVQAAILDGVLADENAVVLADVCPFTLGLKVVSREGIHVDPLIKRNVTVPYETSKVYSAMREYQRAIDLEIYQGESRHTQENTRVGHLLLDSLPRRQGEKAEAEVTFAYDVSGLLHVKARALGNDRTAAADIDITAGSEPAQPPVKLNEWEKAPGAAKVRPLLRKVFKALDPFLGEDEFVEEDLYQVLEDCDELKAALIRGDQERADELAQRLKEFLEDFEKYGVSGKDGDMEDDLRRLLGKMKERGFAMPEDED